MNHIDEPSMLNIKPILKGFSWKIPKNKRLNFTDITKRKVLTSLKIMKNLKGSRSKYKEKSATKMKI